MAPSLPPDTTYSVRDIVTRTVCDLHVAFHSVNNKKYSRFKADQWLAQITLAPKVDTDVTAGFGTTKKLPGYASPERLTTWVIGAFPGISGDIKGTRTGGVVFNIKSSDLVKADKMSCVPATEAQTQLRDHLGVRNWLERLADALNSAPNADIDKPSYNTEVTVKFSGSGSYTYAFGHGSDLASLSGSYSINQQLNILMTPLKSTPPVVAVTLPNGDNFGANGVQSRTTVSAPNIESAKQRLDSMSLEQAIRGLRIAPQ